MALLTLLRSFHAEKKNVGRRKIGRGGDGDSYIYNFSIKEAYFL